MRIVKGRPDFSSVVPNIIYGIESKEGKRLLLNRLLYHVMSHRFLLQSGPNTIFISSGLPEIYTEDSKIKMKELIMKRCTELDEDPTIRPSEKISQLRQYGDSLGFSLRPFLGEEVDFEKGSSLFDSHNHHDVSGKETEAQETLYKLKQSLTLPNNSNTLGRKFSSSRLSLSESDRSCKRSNTSAKRRTRRVSLTHWNDVLHGVGEKDSNHMMQPAFQPCDKNESQERCVKRLDSKILATWGIMYCGGSKPVTTALRELSQDYDIDLHIDSFKW